MSKPWQINRRHFLRGAGGVMLSLPMLEIMGGEKKMLSLQPFFDCLSTKWRLPESLEC